MQKVAIDTLRNFNEENLKKLKPIDINNSFTFTIKNSSFNGLNNYYKISIINELNSLVIKAEDKKDENLIYSKKYSLKDLNNLQNISKSENISNIFLFLQNLIFIGTKVQITMSKPNPNEDIISLTIKIINDNSKIVFNLNRASLFINEPNMNELEKKNLIETDDHSPEVSDFTGKNFPQYESNILINNEQNKNNLLGKKRKNENFENSYENSKENCAETINEKGDKNEKNEIFNLEKELSANTHEEKINLNVQNSDDSNKESRKNKFQNDKMINQICNDIKKEYIINNKNINEQKINFIDNNINEQNNSNKENEYNYNNLNSSTNLSMNNIENINNNSKKRLIFSVQTDKNGPIINLSQKSKFKRFLVIRNGEYPEWYLNQLQQEKRRRKHEEKWEEEDEDEDEFKVYSIDNPYSKNVIRINTPMKLRTKTEFIDLSEEDSPFNNTSINSIKENIFNKYNHIIENDLLKSQIITKKEQIELLIDSIEFVNNNRNIEEEEAETNMISKINLLYMSSDDGASSYMFHEKCDGKKNLLIIIQTDANNIFGGFTKKSFDSKKVNKKADRNSFLFNLNKLKIYKGIVGRKNGNYIEPGILSQKKFGPSFLNDAIFMGKNLLSDIGHVGEKQCGYDINIDYEINNGDKYFRAKEVEIYQIIFNDLIFLD